MAINSTVLVWCLAPNSLLLTTFVRLRLIRILLKPLVLIGSVIIILFLDMSQCRILLSMYRERYPLIVLRSTISSSSIELNTLSA